MNGKRIKITNTAGTAELPVRISPDKRLRTEIPIEVASGEEVMLNTIIYAMDSGFRSMVRTGIQNYPDYNEGKIDVSEYSGKIFKQGIVGTATGGTKAFTAFGIKEGLVAISKRIGKEGFKRFARSHAMTAIAFGVVEQGADSIKFYQGTIDTVDYKISTSENMGSTGGAISGAAMGAMLGSVLPGLGTVMGSAIGAMFGSYAGASGGRSVGEMLFASERERPDDSPEETSEEEQ